MTLKKITLAATVFLFLLFAGGQGFAQDQSNAEAQSDVLGYLDKTIDWYRSIQATQLTPDSAQEAIILQSVQRGSLKSLRAGFDYAYAEAAVLEPVTSEEDDAAAAKAPSHLAVFQKNVEDNIAAIQKQRAAIDKALARAGGAARTKLLQQKQALAGALELQQAQEDLLTGVKGFLSSPKTNDHSFAGAIKTLERSFPELKPMDTAAPDAASSKAAAVSDGAAEKAKDVSSAARSASGIIAAISDFLPLWQRGRQIDVLIAQLDALEKTNDSLRTDLRTDIVAAGAQGRAMTLNSGVTLPPPPSLPDAGNAAPAATPAAATPAPTADDFAKLTARFKLLSAAVVPLGQQHQAFETCRAQLVQWRSVLTHDFTASLLRLAVRIFFLIVLILIPLSVSELSRRAANRYVRDTRRRRQLRTVRRAIVSTVVGVVVFLSLFAEVGSLATYIGLLTAGIAVALQQVILSMFAYLFFFGRFGVRVGERVTIGGVTGEVIEAGLLRVYLMEIVENRPTGRVSIFPNLVFFQPGAVFKQIADTSYGWQELSYLFAPGTDQKAVHDFILRAAGAIYADYQDAIRRQQTLLENTTHLHIELPRPACILQTMERGLLATLRFPAEPGQEEAISKLMSDAVEAALKQENRFQRLDSADTTPSV